MADMGHSIPSRYWLTLRDQADPVMVAGDPWVRIVAKVNFPQGLGSRFCDLTVQEAERFGVELIQAAQQASEMAARVKAAAA
jgi:hypothetical protein